MELDQIKDELQPYWRNRFYKRLFPNMYDCEFKSTIDGVVELIHYRNIAKKAKEYATADKIRNCLDALGLWVDDTKRGIKLRMKNEHLYLPLLICYIQHLYDTHKTHSVLNEWVFKTKKLTPQIMNKFKNIIKQGYK